MTEDEPHWFAVHPRTESFVRAFRGSANGYAIMYGGPVYLVGSFITAPREAGDIDIRVQLEREDLHTWFGEGFDHRDWPAARWAMEREQLKQSRRLTRRWWQWTKGLRFDLQFQCALFSDFDGLPIMRSNVHIRLDETPLHLFAAGRGEP